jgi:two-component system, NtrC family, nitrogen regulation response regulator NtrX
LDELESVVQNLFMMSLGESITQADVQRVLANFQGQRGESSEQHMPLNLDQPLREARDDFERFYFQYHMRLVKNNMSRLSEISGLERTHLYRKLKQLGIKIKG